jgi:predicted flap endonuclease-1-like 5' DNA nuclease/cell fate (sporulation/competence/biofilm development) regulator YmcA (YheA/YmcA/DUF963 family)
MPEITAASIALIAVSAAVGAVAGWFTRAGRCAQEKTAVSEGWQRQLGAQRKERDRLLEQNRALLEQVSQLRASGRDATNRARELSAALKEVFERRDQLQRELKEIRSRLERTIRHRDELQSEIRSSEARSESARAALQEKNARISRLNRALADWHRRLPPLIERYRERDAEARDLAQALASARARIDELEREDDAGSTRVEPVDREQLGDELDASNDPTNVSYTGLERVLAEDGAAGGVEDTAGRPQDRDGEAAGAAVAEMQEREPGGLRDNLRLIKGIGPTIEKTLNELGIFRFNQIAEMSEYDIYRIARRLKGFSTRIYREDWIGQARNLQLKQSGT